MAQTSQPSGSTGRPRRSVMAKLVLATAFALVMIGVFTLIVRKYIARPETTVDAPAAQFPAVQVAPARGGEVRPTFSGMVMDAETHSPVNDFSAILGSSGNDMPASYDPNQRHKQFSGGRYTVAAQWALPASVSWYVRIEARGYLPVVSSPQHASGTVDFELTAAKDIVGHVYGIDGKPAANVPVGLEAPRGVSHVPVLDGKLIGRAGILLATDSDGAYDFPPQTGYFSIVAASPEAGFGIVDQNDIATSSDIHLAAWAGVKGRVLFGDKPAAGAKVYITSALFMPPKMPGLDSIQTAHSATTDADGRYNVMFVMPGPVQLAREVEQTFGPQGREFSSAGHSQALVANVEPGKVAAIDIGGGGRRVVGKIVYPALPADASYLVDAKAVGAVTMPDVPQMPDVVKKGAPKVRQEWIQTFLRSSAGRQYLQDNAALVSQPSYCLEFDKDGAFHIEDVQPGDYQLTVNIQKVHGSLGLKSAQTTFAMPAITDDLKDTPLEIGDIELKAN